MGLAPSVLPIARREWILRGWNRIAVPDAAIRAMDNRLSATLVGKYLFGPLLGPSLGPLM